MKNYTIYQEVKGRYEKHPHVKLQYLTNRWSGTIKYMRLYDFWPNSGPTQWKKYNLKLPFFAHIMVLTKDWKFIKHISKKDLFIELL